MIGHREIQRDHATGPGPARDQCPSPVQLRDALHPCEDRRPSSHRLQRVRLSFVPVSDNGVDVPYGKLGEPPLRASGGLDSADALHGILGKSSEMSARCSIVQIWHFVLTADTAGSELATPATTYAGQTAVSNRSHDDFTLGRRLPSLPSNERNVLIGLAYVGSRSGLQPRGRATTEFSPTETFWRAEIPPPLRMLRRGQAESKTPVSQSAKDGATVSELLAVAAPFESCQSTSSRRVTREGDVGLIPAREPVDTLKCAGGRWRDQPVRPGGRGRRWLRHGSPRLGPRPRRHTETRLPMRHRARLPARPMMRPPLHPS
jgi:hypothetical protein